MKAIHVPEPGGPEKMQLVDVPTPQPGPQQALVRLHAFSPKRPPCIFVHQ